MAGHHDGKEKAQVSSPSKITSAELATKRSAVDDVSVKEELYRAAGERISELNKVGIAQGRTDINEPKRDHISVLITMEEFENWIKHAKQSAVNRRLEKGHNQIVGREIDLEELLDDVSTHDGRMKKCRHSIFIAPAGMGKTTLFRRIARYGRQGKLKKLKGKLIVMPDFRSFPTDKKLHPSQAILGTMFFDQDDERMKRRYQWMMENSDEVVFLIDSLDALAFDFDIEHLHIGPNTEALPEEILHNLLSGNLFPNSNIISTSREYKVRNMHPTVQPDRCIVLDGLQDKSVRDLIGEFLGEEKGKEVERHIKSECQDVWELLKMPAFLIFAMIGFAAGGFMPNTMSGILIKYYLTLILSNQAQAKNIRDALVKLMAMSFEGIRDGCVLFNLEHFKRFGIIPNEDIGTLFSVCTGNSISKLMQNDGFLLSFNHPTLQECLAAFHVLSIDLEKFKTFVKTELFKHRTNFIVVRRILCGTLLNPPVLEAVRELIQIPDIDRKKSILLETLRHKLEYQIDHDVDRDRYLLGLFIALNEGKSGTTDIIRSSVTKINLSDSPVSLMDVQLAACIMNRCENLNEVNLSNSNLTGEKMEILVRTLMQSNLRFEELDVGYNPNLGSDGFHHLGKLVKDHGVQVLAARECKIRSEHLKQLSRGLAEAKLRELDVSRNVTLESGGFHCLGKFVHDHEVENLNAASCDIRSESVENLSRGLGESKVDVLTLWDSHEPLYTPLLLNLFRNVNEILDLRLWKINEHQQQELKNKLFEQTESPLLSILFGKMIEHIHIYQSMADTASETSSSQDSSDQVETCSSTKRIKSPSRSTEISTSCDESDEISIAKKMKRDLTQPMSTESQPSQASCEDEYKLD